jgi:hypothetical protein
VTCGSAIKLTHSPSNYKLHSNRNVAYGNNIYKYMHFYKKSINSIHSLTHLKSFFLILGSGSGQQSITGITSSDDPESLWIVKASNGEICKRG